MPTKIEGRPSSRHDLIEDIVEAPSSSTFASNSITSFMMDGSKTLPNRNFGSYSNIPTLFNKKLEKPPTNVSSGSGGSVLPTELRERFQLGLPRSNSSSTMISSDERRKELDLVLKHLYDGKLLTSMNDDRPTSEVSEPTTPTLGIGPITTTNSHHKNDDDNRMNLGNLDLLSLDGDGTSLQRELQEKELDIIHLHKEIQELQLENKLLRAKVPTSYANGHTTNTTELEVLRREKEVLQNELRTQQESLAKLQLQHHHNGNMVRANRVDEVSLHQKEALERKLKAYEKQLRTLNGEYEKLKQYCQESERTVSQLKRENDELQQKANDAKKRNDELLYQEFNALRNDLKSLKQRNDELFEENRRLQQEHQRQQQNLAWRSTLQQAFGNELPPPQSSSSSAAAAVQQTPVSSTSSHLDHITPSSPMKSANIVDPRRDRPKIVRSESPNVSEGSDSTNYLTTVSVERYNNRPLSSVHRSATIDANNHHRTSRYTQFSGPEDLNRNNYTTPLSKSVDPQLNYRSSKLKRSVEWDEESIQQNEGSQHRDMNNYDQPQSRPQRHNSSDGILEYMSSGGTPMTSQLPPSGSSSHLYQQNYGLSRSVTLPESSHQSRRSNSYNMPIRHMNNDDDPQQDDRSQPRNRRTSVETSSPKRPYAPASISDIRLNDLIKFSRPGGKISKGAVKYIGPLPGKSDQYLGLELEDEESKHDGVYQGQRLFQCKPNKGVFVGFSKVIMAWSGK